MLESFGKCVHILRRKQRLQIDRLWRVTPQQLNAWFLLECTRDFIARENDWNSSVRSNHPVCQFSLGMRVRSINFIQHQTQGHRIVAQQGCNTSRVLTRLNEMVNIGKTSHGLTGIDFQCFKPTGSGCRESQRCFSDPRRTIQDTDRGIRLVREILLQPRFYLSVSDNSIEINRTTSFTPHISLFVFI